MVNFLRVPKPRDRDRSTEGKRETEQDTERARETKRDQRGERQKVQRVKGKKGVWQFLNMIKNHK